MAQITKVVCFGFMHVNGVFTTKIILSVYSFTKNGAHHLNAMWRKIEYDFITAQKAYPISEEVSRTFNKWMKDEVAQLVHHHWPIMKIDDIHTILAHNLEAFIATLNEE